MKVFVSLITLGLSIAMAQNADSVKVQTDSSDVVTGTVIEDEELILGDDEDIRKAAEHQADTGIVSPVTSPSQVIGKALEDSAESTDDELKLDGGEESLFESVKSKPEMSTDSVQAVADSAITAAKMKLTANETKPFTDTTAEISDTLSRQLKTSQSESKKGTPVTATTEKKSKIEKTNSINFARNLKEYRSPKLAMLMSLLVPGTGQVYANHNSWKAAIFGTVEVGMVATSIAVRYKGKEKEKAAHKFADEHYSYQQYRAYQDTVLPLLISGNDTIYKNIYIGGMDTIFESYAANKNKDFYKHIKDNDQPFVRGWKDVAPGFNGRTISDTIRYSQRLDSAFLVYPKNGDSTLATYGYSEYQDKYRSDISDANGLFRTSGLVFRLMIINHIISAIDAGFTAKAHNDKLLRKESVWQHINLEQICVSTGKGVIPGYALKVRF